MKRLRKSVAEPDELANFKLRHAAAPALLTWRNFKAEKNRREAVRKRLQEDQRGLCAYCENSLVSGDESVEHFIARHIDHRVELDWNNLLLCCAGGERPLPEDVADAHTRFDPKGAKTCGHAKLGTSERIANPLQLPASPRLFRFKSETGEIEVDEGNCAAAGVDANDLKNTIAILGLRVDRLNRARLAIIGELSQQLGTDGLAPAFSPEREREIAEQQIPAHANLPSFFTTIRWFLGLGAEAHLVAVSFDG